MNTLYTLNKLPTFITTLRIHVWMTSDKQISHRGYDPDETGEWGKSG
jgi:hypothetical protein